MTLQAIDVHAVQQGAGAALQMAIPGVFFDEADLKVWLVDGDRSTAEFTETLLADPADYSVIKQAVAGTNPAQYTGTITTVASITATQSVVILIDQPNDQITNFREKPYDPGNFEHGFDKSAMRDQSQLEFFKRSPRQSMASAAVAQLWFPDPVAGKLLIARDDGLGWKNGPDAGNIADAEANAAAAAASAVAASLSESAAAASAAAAADLIDNGFNQPQTNTWWGSVGSPSKIQRLNDRVFIAGATANDGQEPPFTDQDWYGDFANNPIHRYNGVQAALGNEVNYAQLAVLYDIDNPNATLGVPQIGIFSSVTNLNAVNGASPRAMEFIAWSNPATPGTSAPIWGCYGEGHRLNTNSIASTYGMELAVRNTASAVTGWTPYSFPGPALIGLQIQSGAGRVDGGMFPATAALYFSANPEEFGVGIIFKDGTVGAYGPGLIKAAVSMPSDHGIYWFHGDAVTYSGFRGGPTGNLFLDMVAGDFIINTDQQIAGSLTLTEHVIHSSSYTLNNNEALALPAPLIGTLFEMFVTTTTGTKSQVPVGVFRVRAGGAPFVESISVDETTVDFLQDTVLTGTDGANLKFSISSDVDTIYYENRTGGPLTIKTWPLI